jgi:hypothetical protein
MLLTVVLRHSCSDLVRIMMRKRVDKLNTVEHVYSLDFPGCISLNPVVM